MRSRILLAVVVLGAIVAWARCYDPVDLPDSVFFLGCFNGALTDPPIDGSVTVVIETVEIGPGGVAGPITGCIRTVIGIKSQFATLSGSLDPETSQRAVMTAMPAGGDPPFDLLIEREPSGAANAVEIDVTTAAGAPFNQAANLARCEPVATCAALASSLRTVNEPVLELP
jgi:hypothetical protein